MSAGKYVVFDLNNELYGLAIESVEQILEEREVTRIPRTPKVLLGAFDLRGETMPVIDLRIRFALDDYEGPRNFIVVSSALGRFALRVDNVDAIIVLAEADIDDEPLLLKQGGDSIIAGVARAGSRLVILLNVDELLPHEVRKKVASLAAPVPA